MSDDHSIEQQEYSKLAYMLNVLNRESIIESVRKRPGMYFGSSTDASAPEYIVDELVSNVVDLFLSGKATWVRVVLAPPFIEVHDDGPGLPFLITQEGVSLATTIFLRTHATPSAFAHAPHIHLHTRRGIGLAPINAASAELHCSSWIDGQLRGQSFEDGELTSAPHILEEGSGQGTRIRLRLSNQILGVTCPRPGVVRRRLFEAVHLFGGLRAYMGDECFYAPDGLATLAELVDDSTSCSRHEWKARPTFHLRHQDAHMWLEAAALGYADGGETQWKTWVNGRPTPLHGVHKQAFEHVLRAHGWQPSTAVLHLVSREIQFANPTTDELSDARADGIDHILHEAVANYLQRDSV